MTTCWWVSSKDDMYVVQPVLLCQRILPHSSPTTSSDSWMRRGMRIPHSDRNSPTLVSFIFTLSMICHHSSHGIFKNNEGYSRLWNFQINLFLFLLFYCIYLNRSMYTQNFFSRNFFFRKKLFAYFGWLNCSFKEKQQFSTETKGRMCIPTDNIFKEIPFFE